MSLNHGNNTRYFYTTGVEQIPKELKKNLNKQKYHNQYLQNTSIQSDNGNGFVMDLFILC